MPRLFDLPLVLSAPMEGQGMTYRSPKRGSLGCPYSAHRRLHRVTDCLFRTSTSCKVPSQSLCLTTAPSIVSSCSGSLARSIMYWVSLRLLAIQSAVGGSHMFSLFAHSLRVLTARCLLFLIGCKGGLPG